MGHIGKIAWQVLLFLLLSESAVAGIVLSTGQGQVQVQGQGGGQGQNVITTGETTTELVLPAGVGERVCWFNGQKYSKGARMKSGDEWIECARENDYETNGNVIWRSVSELKAIEQQNRSGVQILVK